MTVKIKAYDCAIKRLTETEYPETQALIKFYGVGRLTALTYVLTLGSKEQFRQSRDVGCYLGLRPRRSSSGRSRPAAGHHQGREMPICALYSLSAPIMCLAVTERTRAYDNGA